MAASVTFNPKTGKHVVAVMVEISVSEVPVLIRRPDGSIDWKHDHNIAVVDRLAAVDKLSDGDIGLLFGLTARQVQCQRLLWQRHRLGGAGTAKPSLPRAVVACKRRRVKGALESLDPLSL